MFRKMIRSEHFVYFLIAIFIAFDFQYFVRNFVMENDEKENGELIIRFRILTYSQDLKNEVL